MGGILGQKEVGGTAIDVTGKGYRVYYCRYCARKNCVGHKKSGREGSGEVGIRI